MGTLCPACQKTNSNNSTAGCLIVAIVILLTGVATIHGCSGTEPSVHNSPEVSKTIPAAPYDSQKILEKATREFADKDYSATVNTLTELNAADLKGRQASSLYSRANAFVVKADAEDAKAKRLTYAETYERLMLKAGMDATVRTEGKNADTLVITYVLVNRPLVYNMINDSDTTSEWSSLGFKKVRFSDGYDSSWSQSLQ